MMAMAHRMQVTLEDRHYDVLQRESERTGASIAALVRRAIDTAYESDLDTEQRLALLEEGFGAWAERADGEDAHEAWRSLRPALGAGDP
jgi:hypothetical protein